MAQLSEQEEENNEVRSHKRQWVSDNSIESLEEEWVEVWEEAGEGKTTGDGIYSSGREEADIEQ